MNKLHLAILCVLAQAASGAEEKIGPFFEPGFPFYQTQIDITAAPDSPPDNFVVRGLVIPLGPDHVLAFDQDLLRVAGVWRKALGEPLVTLMNMAQTSYAVPNRKCGAEHSKPTGDVLFASALKPGIAQSPDQLAEDPRMPNAGKDFGRGPLPLEHGRFEGVELRGDSAVLKYRAGDTQISEWHEIKTAPDRLVVIRHLEVAPHAAPVHFSCGAFEWELPKPQLAMRRASNGRHLSIRTNSASLALARRSQTLTATLSPRTKTSRVSIAMISSQKPDPEIALPATPPLPAIRHTRRWPQTLTTKGALDTVQANGLTIDRIPLPFENPWQRRIRCADIDFLNADQAAVVTYDGDVWLLDGLQNASLSKVGWSRFASGLHEPLAIAVTQGVVQVATKNGIVRLHDTDGNGETDWYQNFSDVMRQSQSTRSFPLDMDIGPDGCTYLSAGGIKLGGDGTPFTGGIARIAPDGKAAELISQGAREPYLTVHPTTGILTGTDQQGNFIPSSVCYLIQPGAHFGFGIQAPPKLAPPLVWIPHTEDNSSASQVWITGEQFGKYSGKLLHLSYGNGGLFLISPDLGAETPQGAVIPLGVDTRIPLLQGRMHPSGGSVYLTGFKIYDSRASNQWALARMRRGKNPITTPLNARSCADGVILEFETALDPASVSANKVIAQAWNYKRSSAYGSGRYRKDGEAGMDPVGVSQAVLSEDRKSVFIHLPELAAVMQLEIRHSFKLASGALAEGATYFTVHQPRKLDLRSAGFNKVDLSKTSFIVTHRTEGPASPELGQTLSVSMGCIACHSTDGSQEGRTGPTWKGLFGKDRQFSDGSIESANEFYLRDSMINPQSKVVKGFEPSMASYKGVLTKEQIESLVLYIKTLR
jgi:glucose/arabinose dehydrogenase/cytochrome c2